MLTCSHVISAALGLDNITKPSKEVMVSFPLSEKLDTITFFAKVVLWKPTIFDLVIEDIALLELESFNAFPQNSCVQLVSNRDTNQGFVAFGFPPGRTFGGL